MASIVTKIWRLVKRLCRLAWLTGPVVGKELRVASRQGKYYLLRLAYVGLLCLVIFYFWHAIVRVGGGAAAVARCPGPARLARRSSSRLSGSNSSPRKSSGFSGSAVRSAARFVG